MSKIADVIRSVTGILLFFLSMLAMIPFLLVANILMLGRATDFFAEKVASRLVIPVFKIIGIRFRILDHSDGWNGQAMYIFNHGSTLDIISLLRLGIPHIRYVAKWELQYNPIFFILGRITGQIFIRRQQSQKAVQTLQKAYSRIKKMGYSILMAPEGSRKHEGIIGPFKKGPFRMAMDLGIPIVPIYLEGNQNLSQGGSLITSAGELTAHIYPPIPTRDWKPEELDKNIDEIRGRYISFSEGKLN